jgi:hypothetical protein
LNAPPWAETCAIPHQWGDNRIALFEEAQRLHRLWTEANYPGRFNAVNRRCFEGTGYEGNHSVFYGLGRRFFLGPQRCQKRLPPINRRLQFECCFSGIAPDTGPPSRGRRTGGVSLRQLLLS